MLLIVVLGVVVIFAMKYKYIDYLLFPLRKTHRWVACRKNRHRYMYHGPGTMLHKATVGYVNCVDCHKEFPAWWCRFDIELPEIISDLLPKNGFTPNDLYCSPIYQHPKNGYLVIFKDNTTRNSKLPNDNAED